MLCVFRPSFMTPVDSLKVLKTTSPSSCTFDTWKHMHTCILTSGWGCHYKAFEAGGCGFYKVFPKGNTHYMVAGKYVKYIIIMEMNKQ